jgi:hypothetical protein
MKPGPVQAANTGRPRDRSPSQTRRRLNWRGPSCRRGRCRCYRPPAGPRFRRRRRPVSRLEPGLSVPTTQVYSRHRSRCPGGEQRRTRWAGRASRRAGHRRREGCDICLCPKARVETVRPSLGRAGACASEIQPVVRKGAVPARLRRLGERLHEHLSSGVLSGANCCIRPGGVLFPMGRCCRVTWLRTWRRRRGR